MHMPRLYVSQAQLRLTRTGVVATGGLGSAKEPVDVTDPLSLFLLELLVNPTERDVAYSKLSEILAMPRLLELRNTVHADGSDVCDIWLGSRKFMVRTAPDDEIEDLTSLSAATHGLLLALVHEYVADGETLIEPTREVFEDGFDKLYDSGLIGPAFFEVQWGDLRRSTPICPWFGWGRGTPIDRYYLDKFVTDIRQQVSGVAVEIGGTAGNAARYGFRRVRRYLTLDMSAAHGVDIVGDAHDSSLLRPESVDSIIAFNVLEHCIRPWVVVENMRTWLRGGGGAFCMVPNAQRIHNMPGDYWRPMPSALSWMFREFRNQKVYQYGNPAALIAAYMGIAAEELSSQELDETHPDFPVATCVAALK